ncbi:MAG: PilN domain-containing protein [Magnetococcales bacterium]|nr:PilN domain-containing protein [Magnetococcales bacterium]
MLQKTPKTLLSGSSIDWRAASARLAGLLTGRAPCQGGFGLAQWPGATVLVHLDARGEGPHPVDLCAVVEDAEPAGRLAEVLRSRGLGTGRAVGVLVPGQYQVFSEEGVPAPEEELADIMRWRVKDRLEFPVEEAVVATYPIPAQKRDDGDERRMRNVVVAHQEDVLRQVGMMALLQLAPEGIDAWETAMGQLLLAGPGAGHPGVLLHVGVEESMVLAVDGRRLVYVRRLKVGSARIRAASQTTDGTSAAGTLDLEPLALELLRTLDYVESRFVGDAPRRLVLAPLPDPVSGLGQALAGRLKSWQVEALNPDPLFRFANGRPDEATLARVLPALGAALARARPIGTNLDLLEARLQPSHDWVGGRLILTLGGVSLLLAALVAGVAQGRLFQEEAALQSLKTLEAPLLQEVIAETRLRPAERREVKLESQVRQMADQVALDRKLLDYLNNSQAGNSTGFAGHLEDLATRSVEGVWLTGLTIMEGGRELAIAARGVSPERIPRFITAVGESPNFAGRGFDILKIDTLDKEPGKPVEFRLLTNRLKGMRDE